MAVLARSEHPGMHGPLWGGWAVGAQSCCEGTGITPHYSIYACREADQPEVLLCSFRPIFTLSESA